ncbi:piggyBac transposable element-derived protein 2-like [Schistocerca americana]|uniref:piggyBac transposable element-derived protein 2-like n=1 Tax=Schistocerca americana TaxID=7009 RepID=UPI001F4FD5A8|nr:piggyBac transposable element-derived protein 2-like [Schistocerca americana]
MEPTLPSSSRAREINPVKCGKHEVLLGDEILLLHGDDSEISDDEIVLDDESDYDPSGTWNFRSRKCKLPELYVDMQGSAGYGMFSLNLVTQANLYSTQVLQQSINTSANEIRQFIGIHLLSGIFRRYLLVNDNANMLPRDDPHHGKLFKVRPFLDQLKNNFLKTEVEEYNSTDELIIPLKSHTSLCQYKESKPHKWGMKVFARTGGSGYIYDFEVYVGKGTITASNPELGMSGNQYSLEMKEYMLWEPSEKTVKNDSEMKKEDRGTCDYRVDEENKIITLKWYDSKAVQLIATYKGKEPVGNVER